jgi:hypothetical protein
MKPTDHTLQNWQIIHHVYDGWVKLDANRLQNIKLPNDHFQALVLAARTKPFRGRSRADNSLRNAVGNWLYTREFGAWRNPNRAKPYQGDNKRLWQEFIAKTPEYSLREATG